MTAFYYSIGATVLVSLISFVGILALSFKAQRLDKVVTLMVALSAGTLLGGALLHLLPEAQEELEGASVFGIVLLALIFFFLIEKVLFWRHCHKPDCKVHPFGYLNLLGEAIHNFIDGLVIAGAFLVSKELGFATTLAIIFHEIPQEFGDFGVLLKAGFTKRKALFLNFLIALTAILGAIAGYFLGQVVENLTGYLLALAAGGFLYIAASDLIPEIREERDKRQSVATFGVFLLGALIMLWLK